MSGMNTGYDLIRRLFDGFSSHEIGAFFVSNGHWPKDMPPESAAARARACLDPNRDQYMKFSELRAWTFHTGRRVLVDDLCDGLGLMRPMAVADGDRLQEIRQRLDDNQAEREALLAEAAAYLPQGWSAGESTGVDELGTPESVERSRFLLCSR